MGIETDFSVDLDSGDIRHVSGTTVYNVLDLHLYLQDLADDATGIDNDNPSVLAGKRDATKPTVLTLPNDGPLATEFNIDDDASQYINFGSVEQKGGDELYSGFKTIGGIVSASPIYVVQNNSKLSKFWSDGHIQILIKAKTGGSLIDNGDVTAYSRKYGQTYSTFDVNLAAGSETAAAIATSIDSAITLSLAAAQTVFGNITITPGAVSKDLGNGNGAKPYKGVINVNGEALSDVYQALMYATNETSTETINGVPGWRYRKLDAAYTENAAYPFGSFAGGKWFVAQGWWIEGYGAGDAQAFELIDDNGDTQAPPVSTGVTIGNLISGDRVLVAIGSGGVIDKTQYTLASGNDSGDGTIVINETIPADTPNTGFVRIGDDRYEYTSWSGSTFTLSGTLSQSYSSGTDCYVPLIDVEATSSSETVTVTYVSNRDLVIHVRHGSGSEAIVPFSTTGTMSSSATTINTVRQADV